jgi:ribose transport system substrate-binding protein
VVFIEAGGSSTRSAKEEGMRKTSCNLSGTPTRLPWTRWVIVAALAAGLLVLAGCGGGSSKTTAPQTTSAAGAGVSAAARKTARATLAKGEQPPEFTAPGPAFDASKARGKTLFVVNLLSSIPLIQVSNSAAADALKLVGARFVQYDGKGSVSEYSAGINQAISQHADAIALFAIDPNLVAGPLKKAKAAGIPVIVIQYGDPGAQMPFGLDTQVTYCYSCAGKLMASYILANAKDTAPSVALLESTEVTNSKWEIDGFKNTFDQLCPSCKVIEQNVPVADWQTKIPTLTQSLIRSHPNLDYIVPIYDGMALFVVPAIHSANAADKVSVVTFNGTLGLMQNMADGNVVRADIGSPQAWEGWALADQFLRIVTGQKPLVDTKVGLRAFDETNIADVPLKKPEATWYGVDFEPVYKKMWGVGK